MLLFILVLCLPLVGTAQCFETHDKIIEKINQKVQSDEITGFTAYRVNYNFEGVEQTKMWEVCRVRQCKDVVSIALGDAIKFQYNSDSAWYVNNANGWCVASSINNEMGFRDFSIVLNNNITEHLADYADFIFYGVDFSDSYKPASYIGNKTVDSVDCAVFQYIPASVFMFNSETGQYDIPVHDTIRYYFDTQSWYIYRIDHVSSRSKIIQTYLFLDYNNESANGDCLRIDPADTAFAEYKLYQSCMGPYREDYDDGLSKVPDKTINYPLVRAGGDTTCLCNYNGWKLINYWCYGCAPCLRFFDQINADRQQNGRLSLEKENIQLFLVNFKSNNTDTFRKYVERFHIEDYGYAAIGLPGLAVPFTPYFYLIAPDGTIVYAGEAKPISEFVKVKKEYINQQRKNKNK